MVAFFVSVVFEDFENNKDCIICVVYGPNVNQRRAVFWSELDSIRARWNGPWCIRGDFNIIRFPEEKLSGCRISPEMIAFSDWISSQSLLDLLLNDASFTWSNHGVLPILS